jgi:glycosyltransferase involved in cell wall biosynthesis
MIVDSVPAVSGETVSRAGGVTFSLVLATVGRTSELEQFLKHLDEQSYRKFELIVVDQNPDSRLRPVLAPYLGRFSLVHCRSEKGLSRARNVGVAQTSGDVLAFPDDDCSYPSDLLERVAGLFSRHPDWDGITGRPIDPTFSRYHTVSGPVDKTNVFLRSTSFTIFLRRQVVRSIGGFDESLGLGAESGRTAAEESDYLIRALSAHHKIFYCSDLTVFHHVPEALYDDRFNRKARDYNLAFGHVLRKHQYPFWYVFNTWLRAAGGVCASVLIFRWPKARYHYSVLQGRIKGWLR